MVDFAKLLAEKRAGTAKACGRTWSPLQLAIYEEMEHGTGNLIVEAVAGSGKTTTLVEGVKRTRGNHVFLAFNKSISVELSQRGVNAYTFHSMCYTPVLRFFGARAVDSNKLRTLAKETMSREEFRLYGPFASKLVGIARQVGIGVLVESTTEVWDQLAQHHELEPDNERASYTKALEMAMDLLDTSNHAATENGHLDFDDLLYMAVAQEIALPKYDLILVDEAQDTNAIQRSLIRKMMHEKTRVVAVGDPAQAIYGFRGADSESLDKIAEEFDAKRLPLSTSYRCPVKVVEYARQWMEHIYPAEGAPQGEVVELGTAWNTKTFKPHDLIICRRSAPLIQLAYSLLRDRVPATILGRDIGDGLCSLVEKMHASELPTLVRKLEYYRTRELEKAHAKGDEKRADSINDRVDTIITLIDSLPEDQHTVNGLLEVICELFTDHVDGVKLSTGHKAKGLEAKRVFWLNRSECPAKWARLPWQQQQEENLCYVITTRAMESLFIIETKKKG